MKKKAIGSVLAAAALSVSLLAGCGASSTAAQTSATPAPAQSAASTGVDYQWDFVKKSDGIDDLKAECDQKGTVVQMDYETPLYISDPLLPRRCMFTCPITMMPKSRTTSST